MCTHLIWSFLALGMGAEFLAIIQEDQTHNRFGQVTGTERVERGEGYYGNILVEFRGGLARKRFLLTLRLRILMGKWKMCSSLLMAGSCLKT